MEQLEQLLTIRSVAQVLAITPARAYELARTGALPTVRLGRQIRVVPDALRAFVSAGGKPLGNGSEAPKAQLDAYESRAGYWSRCNDR